jgi:ribokinase
MPSPSSILVVGSSNTDMVIKLDRLPKPGETILGGRFSSVPGGKGANQAIAASRAGGRVTFVGRVGRDRFGDGALAGFRADGVNVNYVMRDPSSPSGVALIFVGPDGENSIAVASGANGRLTPADLRQAQKAFRQARIVLLQLETPLKTVAAAAKLAAAAGARVILNPAPAQSLPAALLRRVWVLTPNGSEAELLTGIAVTGRAGAEKAAAALLARGVQNVIVTLGAGGAFVAGRDDRRLVPGYKVRALDSTGAGDVFNGALAVALAEGQSLMEAARFANAAAAISVTRMGAQAAAPARREIQRLLATGRLDSAIRPQARRVQTSSL